MEDMPKLLLGFKVPIPFHTAGVHLTLGRWFIWMTRPRPSEKRLGIFDFFAVDQRRACVHLSDLKHTGVAYGCDLRNVYPSTPSSTV